MNAANQFLADIKQLGIDARLVARASKSIPKDVVPGYVFHLSLERAAHLHRLIAVDTRLYNYWSLSGVQHPDGITWHLYSQRLSLFIKGWVDAHARQDFELLVQLITRATNAELSSLRSELLSDFAGRAVNMPGQSK